MKRTEQLAFLIHELDSNAVIPADEKDRWILYRSAVNVRPPGKVTDKFLHVQNELLQKENQNKGITFLKDLTPVKPHLYVWQGDITSLGTDIIVNAANSGMTGCYYPCHSCIDNAIHTYAGVQLRNICADIIQKQGHPEFPGHAKITPAYNLPSKYVIHTVGPIVNGTLTNRHRELLRDCYRSCLDIALESHLSSIAFPCISTGEFHFPNMEAAHIAVTTVYEYIKERNTSIDVVFNTFKGKDHEAILKNLSTY